MNTITILFYLGAGNEFLDKNIAFPSWETCLDMTYENPLNIKNKQTKNKWTINKQTKGGHKWTINLLYSYLTDVIDVYFLFEKVYKNKVKKTIQKCGRMPLMFTYVSTTE